MRTYEPSRDLNTQLAEERETLKHLRRVRDDLEQDIETVMANINAIKRDAHATGVNLR